MIDPHPPTRSCYCSECLESIPDHIDETPRKAPRTLNQILADNGATKRARETLSSVRVFDVYDSCGALIHSGDSFSTFAAVKALGWTTPEDEA